MCSSDLQVLKQWLSSLQTDWARQFKANNAKDLELLPLPAFPLSDQKLQTVQDQYQRAKDEKKAFFRPKKGSEAYETYRATQGQVRESATGELPEGAQDLVQVNIESVTCRWYGSGDRIEIVARPEFGGPDQEGPGDGGP